MEAILRNAWYAGAYSHEICGHPLPRRLLGRTSVLFRDDQGTVGILPDRCPHRFAPLSAGAMVDGALACPYHGLRFAADGRCVHNPHVPSKGPLPAANLEAWTVLERYGVVWFWPGDPGRADPELLPRIDFLERADEFSVVRGLLTVRGHYELVVDNLLDLSHAAYLHPQFAGGRYSPDQQLAATTQRLERRPRSIINHRMRSGLAPPPANITLFGMDPDKPVHTDSTMTWHPPAMLDFSAGSWEMDQPRESGVWLPQLHVITPETEFTSHYFFINGRNRRKGEAEIDQAMLDFFDLAFACQDEPMIEKVQANMGQVTAIDLLGPVLLPTDAAPVAARRLLAKLIAEERDSLRAST